MSDSKTNGVLGPKALEMIMRDVLGGMEELALMKGYVPGAEVVEILSIEPDQSESAPYADRCGVVEFSRFRRRKAS